MVRRFNMPLTRREREARLVETPEQMEALLSVAGLDKPHVEFTDANDDDWCVACGQSWPCVTACESVDTEGGES